MNLKHWLYASIPIIPIILAPGVYALETDIASGVVKIMDVLFGSALVEGFMQSGTAFSLFAKFMVWLIIFSLVYMVAHSKFQKKNIAVVISFAVALISVIPLKTSVLQSLFQTFGVVAMGILFFAPIAGLFYVTYTIFGEEGRLGFALKAISFYILAALIHNIAGAMATTMGEANINFMSTGNIAETATGICFLMVVWYIIRAILWSGPETGNVYTPGSITDRIKSLFPTRPTEPRLDMGRADLPGMTRQPLPQDLLNHMGAITRYASLYLNKLNEMKAIAGSIASLNHANVHQRTDNNLAPHWDKLRDICHEIGELAMHVNEHIRAVQESPDYLALSDRLLNEFDDRVSKWVTYVNGAVSTLRRLAEALDRNETM